MCAPVCSWDVPSIITLHIFSSVIYDSRMVLYPWKGLICVILRLPSGYGLCTMLWTLVFSVMVGCDNKLPWADGSWPREVCLSADAYHCPLVAFSVSPLCICLLPAVCPKTYSVGLCRDLVSLFYHAGIITIWNPFSDTVWTAPSLSWCLWLLLQEPEEINPDEELEDIGDDKEDNVGAVEEQRSVILHLLSQLKLGMDLTRVSNWSVKTPLWMKLI